MALGVLQIGTAVIVREEELDVQALLRDARRYRAALTPRFVRKNDD